MHLHSSWNSLIVRGGRIKREEEEQRKMVSILLSSRLLEGEKMQTTSSGS